MNSTLNMVSAKGVALIQVLLITGMLLILVIQMSKDSGRQVQTALLLKNKTELDMQMLSEREKLKFELLTSRKSADNGIASNMKLNFRGDDIRLSNQVTLSLQDEDGLISLPYGGEPLVQLLGGDESRYEQIRMYQGFSEARSLPAGYRGGLMPSKVEVKLAGLIKEQAILEGVTHLPTFQFNLSHTPRKIFAQMYGVNIGAQQNNPHSSGNSNAPDLQNIIGNSTEAIFSPLPGIFFTATFTGRKDKLSIKRQSRIMMNFDQQPYMAEVAVH